MKQFVDALRSALDTDNMDDSDKLMAIDCLVDAAEVKLKAKAKSIARYERPVKEKVVMTFEGSDVPDVVDTIIDFLDMMGFVDTKGISPKQK